MEVEAYRRTAEAALGRPIVAVRAPDPWFVKGGLDGAALGNALVGRRLVAARRRGKLLLLDTSDVDEGDGPVLGLRFGMTGRLSVDGTGPIERLEYGSDRDLPAWVRFALDFDGGTLQISDPRRLGGVVLDPDEDRLGPDAASLTGPELRAALAGSQAPLKARLLDQSRIAGLGNLLVDEILWRAGLDPARPAGGLNPVQRRRLHATILATVAELMRRGGSHTGDLQAARLPGGSCPRDGSPLQRRTVGGRTTYSCSRHQR